MLFVVLFIAVIFLDLILLFGIAIVESASSYSQDTPENTVKQVSSDLEHQQDRSWTISSETQDLLDSHNSWAALLDDNGTVVWSYKTPDGFPATFTTNDLAIMSHYRSWNSYPVYIWTADSYLTVVGYPIETNTFVSIRFDYDSFLRVPGYILLILLIDLMLFFLLYFISQRRVVRYVDPALESLNDLAQGRAAKTHFEGPLRAIGNRINRVSDTLIRKENARKSWVSGVSHDVRTPLAVIMGRAEQIEHDASASQDVRNSAQIITRQGARIRDLVEDLNVATQLEYDMQPVRNDDIVIPRMIREVVVDYINQDTDNTHPIDLEISDSAQTITFKGDEKLLRRALQNAINNAIKHNPDGCTITISLSSTIHAWQLAIADDGCGMNEKQLISLVATLKQEEQDYRALSSSLNNMRADDAPEPPEGRIPISHDSSISIEPMAPSGNPIIVESQTMDEPPVIEDLSTPVPSHTPAPASARTPTPVSTDTPVPAPLPTNAPVPVPPVKDDIYFKPTDSKRKKKQTLTAQEWWGSKSPVIGHHIEPIESSASLAESENETDILPQEHIVKQHGLGIPLITRIVITHGGSIAFGSEKNKGFCIYMRFTS